MARPDFELSGRLRAQRLRSETPAETRTETEHVQLERAERRSHSTGERAAAACEHVLVEKRLRGRLGDPSSQS